MQTPEPESRVLPLSKEVLKSRAPERAVGYCRKTASYFAYWDTLQVRTTQTSYGGVVQIYVDGDVYIADTIEDDFVQSRDVTFNKLIKKIMQIEWFDTEAKDEEGDPVSVFINMV